MLKNWENIKVPAGLYEEMILFGVASTLSTLCLLLLSTMILLQMDVLAKKTLKKYYPFILLWQLGFLTIIFSGSP